MAHGHITRVLLTRWCELELTKGRIFVCDTGAVSIGRLGSCLKFLSFRMLIDIRIQSNRWIHTFEILRTCAPRLEHVWRNEVNPVHREYGQLCYGISLLGLNLRCYTASGIPGFVLLRPCIKHLDRHRKSASVGKLIGSANKKCRGLVHFSRDFQLGILLLNLTSAH